MESDSNPQALAKKVLDMLDRKDLSLACAESATGGLASHLLTNISGSSKHFMGGVVCYTAEAKVELLGVAWDLINDYGTISEEVTTELLKGLRKLGADLGFAICGVAGTQLEGKPPGYMVIGISNNERIQIHTCQFSGDRISIKEQAVSKAFELIIAELNQM